MKEETEVKVRHVLNGYVTPFLTAVIAVMLGLITYFANIAYQDIRQGQKELVAGITAIQLNQATFQEKVHTLEEAKNISEKDIAELKNGMTDIRVKIASLSRK